MILPSPMTRSNRTSLPSPGLRALLVAFGVLAMACGSSSDSAEDAIPQQDVRTDDAQLTPPGTPDGFAAPDVPQSGGDTSQPDPVEPPPPTRPGEHPAGWVATESLPNWPAEPLQDLSPLCAAICDEMSECPGTAELYGGGDCLETCTGWTNGETLSTHACLLSNRDIERAASEIELSDFGWDRCDKISGCFAPSDRVPPVAIDWCSATFDLCDGEVPGDDPIFHPTACMHVIAGLSRLVGMATPEAADACVRNLDACPRAEGDERLSQCLLPANPACARGCRRVTQCVGSFSPFTEDECVLLCRYLTSLDAPRTRTFTDCLEDRPCVASAFSACF